MRKSWFGFSFAGIFVMVPTYRFPLDISNWKRAVLCTWSTCSQSTGIGATTYGVSMNSWPWSSFLILPVRRSPFFITTTSRRWAAAENGEIERQHKATQQAPAIRRVGTCITLTPLKIIPRFQLGIAASDLRFDR